MNTNLRQASRDQRISDLIRVEEVNAGSLQRIADATELMVKTHLQLQRDRDYYERAFKEQKASAETWKRSCTALKGVVTKREDEIFELTRQLNEARLAAMPKGDAHA